LTDPRSGPLLDFRRLLGGLTMFVIEAGIVAVLLLVAVLLSVVILAIL
jgi:hypothetical protein